MHGLRTDPGLAHARAAWQHRSMHPSKEGSQSRFYIPASIQSAVFRQYASWQEKRVIRIKIRRRRRIIIIIIIIIKIIIILII